MVAGTDEAIVAQLSAQLAAHQIGHVDVCGGHPAPAGARVRIIAPFGSRKREQARTELAAVAQVVREARFERAQRLAQRQAAIEA